MSYVFKTNLAVRINLKKAFGFDLNKMTFETNRTWIVQFKSLSLVYRKMFQFNLKSYKTKMFSQKGKQIEKFNEFHGAIIVQKDAFIMMSSCLLGFKEL